MENAGVLRALLSLPPTQIDTPSLSGLAIGREAFVEEIFESARGVFGARRESGARKMKGGDWGELRVARALRVDAVVPPGGDG